MPKNVFAIDDLSLDTIYLANRYYNSKTITWQPCKVTSIEAITNGRIFVTFLEDGSKDSIFVRDRKCADSLGRPTLKVMDAKWVASTLKREMVEFERMQKRIEFLKGLA